MAGEAAGDGTSGIPCSHEHIRGYCAGRQSGCIRSSCAEVETAFPLKTRRSRPAELFLVLKSWLRGARTPFRATAVPLQRTENI